MSSSSDCAASFLCRTKEIDQLPLETVLFGFTCLGFKKRRHVADQHAQHSSSPTDLHFSWGRLWNFDSLSLAYSFHLTQTIVKQCWELYRYWLPCVKFNTDAANEMFFCLRNVLLGPPHDVQSEGVNPCRKFLLCLDKRNFFPCIQVLDHHAGQDFLF